MKIIIFLLLIIPLFSFAQLAYPPHYPLNDTTALKRITIVPCFPDTGKARNPDTSMLKFIKHEIGIKKTDVSVMTCFFGYGFTKGWGDEVEYHHFALSNRFPGLFKNGSTFWDGRYDDDGIWDAKHMLAAIQYSFMTAGVLLKVGDYKDYHKWRLFWKVVTDIVKYDFSRRFGFFVSYNLINQNPLFK